MWLQKLLLSHKWFRSDSAFILDVPEGILINIIKTFMNYLVIILEISVLNNTLGFIIRLYGWAFLFSKNIFVCIHFHIYTFIILV